jgi:hypothetical protein
MSDSIWAITLCRPSGRALLRVSGLRPSAAIARQHQKHPPPPDLRRPASTVVLRMTLGSHQRCVGKSQVHLTPKWLIERLGPFDLDPCAATDRPWDCAKRNYVEAANGLALPWEGLVWLNPPFDRYQVGKWIRKLADHGNGIALVHARTEAEWFRPIWQDADLILFLDKRIKFCRPDGTEQSANSGAPVVLAAFGATAALRILKSRLTGARVKNAAMVEAA